MASRHASPPASPPIASVDIMSAAAMSVPQPLTHLATTADGLSAAEASRRLSVAGPNAVRSHRAQFMPVLLRQFRSPLLVLLAITAVASYFVGERSDALIIGLILAASVGLGCVNEYRAEKTAEALHSRMQHRCIVRRAGTTCGRWRQPTNEISPSVACWCFSIRRRPAPLPRCDGCMTSASRSRPSSATILKSAPGCAPISACRPARR